MEVENLNDGEASRIQIPITDQCNNGEGQIFPTDRLAEEIDSTCSTPYVSAPSSPGRGAGAGFFYSAPASPMHFMLSGTSSSSDFISSSSDVSVEFEFTARSSQNSPSPAGSMISADQLFLNGQIRPMKLSTHLQRPQNLAPLLDADAEDEGDEEAEDREGKLERCEESVVRGRDLKLLNRPLHRRTRSMSPSRNRREAGGEGGSEISLNFQDSDPKGTGVPSEETTPSVSASSSRSSSTSGRGSKRWIFLMDFLHRSKSEGRGHGKERFWSSISFSPSQKEKKAQTASRPSSPSAKVKRTPSAPIPARKPAAAGTKPEANVAGQRRLPPSPHELHYTANRAQAEEMKKKTYLPYRQGVLGCLGFSSKSYGAMNGFARTLNPVSSR